jgi:tetratricopeptide (TPR) repeat protein
LRLIYSFIIIALGLIFLLPGAGCQKKSKTETPVSSGKFPLDTLEIQIDELTKKIQKKPNLAVLYFQRARLYELQKKLMPSIQDMQRSVRIDSTRYQYWDYLGDLFFQASGVKPAITAYKKSAALNPKSEYPYVKMGEIYMITQDAPNAFENLNEALHINKFNGKAYFLKGYIYLEMGDTAKAVSSFQTSVDVDPDYYDSYINLGLIYAKRKNKKAVFYYETCLRLKPGNIEVLYDLGKYYQDINSFDKASEYYNLILETIPDHKNANYNLGYINFMNGDFEKAIIFFSKAISKLPTYSDAYFARGQCYKMLKKTTEAMNDFKKTLELDPKNSLARKEMSKLIKE